MVVCPAARNHWLATQAGCHPPSTDLAASKRIPKALTFRSLLQPHLGALSLASLLLPLKELQTYFSLGQSRSYSMMCCGQQGGHEWVRRLFPVLGSDGLSGLQFACLVVPAIAVVDAICSYGEKYLTTSVAQWVSYDLGLAIYSHIQRLSPFMTKNVQET